MRQAELRLSTMAGEKACQQAALSEKTCSVDQLTFEKQQMTDELEVQRMQLTQLKGTDTDSSECYHKLQTDYKHCSMYIVPINYLNA